jgi:hypothetical protein
MVESRGPGGKLVRTGSLNTSPQVLLALQKLKYNHERKVNKSKEHFDQVRSQNMGLKRPGQETNSPFKTGYIHIVGESCDRHNVELGLRNPQEKEQVVIYYRKIVSRN